MKRSVAVTSAIGILCLGCGETPREKAPVGSPPAPSTVAAAPPPVGSAGFCPGDDGTHLPLATSTLRSELDLATAQGELDARNSICGDTWCEGSFEWFFYDLRSGGGKSELTMRTYSRFVSPAGADATQVVVRGDRFVGRVLGQKIVPTCTSPCKGFKTPPHWEPCLVLDLRCEVAAPWRAQDRDAWEQTVIACGIAVEKAVRAIHPEFAR